MLKTLLVAGGVWFSLALFFVIALALAARRQVSGGQAVPTADAVKPPRPGRAPLPARRVPEPVVATTEPALEH